MDTLSISKLNQKVDSVLTVVHDISKHDLKSLTTWDIGVIIFLIILMGAIGGFANYLSMRKNDKPTWINITNSILLSVIGASLIPLLLNLISSNLLESCVTSNSSFFVLGGYMLIAAIFAKRLISTLGKKILNIEEMRKEMDKKIKDSQTEPNPQKGLPASKKEKISNEITTNMNMNFLSGESGFGGQENKSLGATKTLLNDMKTSRYKFRNLNGIMNSTHLEENQVLEILNILKSNHIIEEEDRNGETYFNLTEYGQGLQL